VPPDHLVPRHLALTGLVRPHDHACLVYDDPRARIDVTVPYFIDGLERGESCLVVGGREFTESVEAGLEAAGIDLNLHRDRGALMVATCRETHLASGPRPGTFSPVSMVNVWREMVHHATRRGFAATRLAVEPTWALQDEQSTRELIAYETLVNGFLASAPATGLCLYRRDQWPAAAVIDALRTHNAVVLGEVVCHGNLFYDAPELPRTEDRADAARLTWMLGQLRDTTARERALTEARDAAVAANRLKDEFLAALAHEMRTPLASIVGWTSVLRRAELPPERVQQALGSIERNAAGMTRMVNDLVDLSAMLAGQLSLVRTVVDTRTVVRDAVDAIRPIASERRLRLDVEEPTEPVRVKADADRLRQCVLNLLSNAVKFTPTGGTVTVRVEPQHGKVAIHVSDTGEGISATSLLRVFDRFWRATESPSGSGSGLGLGLAITKQLVELHDGRVSASSAGEGRGAVFTIELPASS
jgi:signal transduction histidine kinase